MGEGKAVTPEAEAEELEFGYLWNVARERHRYPGVGGSSPWLCVAAYSSPGSRPTPEAQRKPRLSEAESGVLPILVVTRAR